MQISPSTDWRHTAAAENGLTLIVAGITHNRTEDGQPAVEVAQTAGHQHTVLTPRDAQFDERSTEEKECQMFCNLTVPMTIYFLCMIIKWFWFRNNGPIFISLTIWHISINLFNQLQNRALRKERSVCGLRWCQLFSVQTDYFMNRGMPLVDCSGLLQHIPRYKKHFCPQKQAYKQEKLNWNWLQISLTEYIIHCAKNTF